MNKRVNYFIKNLGIFLIGSFGTKFLTFLLIPIFTSVLSTTQYGKIDLVITTQSLLFPLVTFAFSEAIFRYVMNSDIDNRSILSNSIFIESILYICTLLIANIVNIFVEWEYMPWMLAILGGSMMYDLLLNYLKASQNSKKYVIIGVVYTAINLTCNILFIVVFHWGIEGYLLAIIVAYVIPSIVVLFIEGIYRQFGFKFIDVHLAKRMMHYSFPLIFTSLSWWVITSSDRYMIRYFMTNSDVGIYSIASKIPLILQTLISILQTVWQISTNQMHDEEPEQLRENFALFTKIFRQVGFISGSVLIILTQPLMMILARNDFYSRWIYAPFLILSIVFSFGTGMVATLYGAYEKNSGVLYSVLLGGGINIILNAVLIPQIGVIGATVSTAISRLVIAIYRLKDTEKFLQFDREYFTVAINCILITAQCSLLIIMHKAIYPIQVVFLVIICIYNREIFSKGFRYIRGIIGRS